MSIAHFTIRPSHAMLVCAILIEPGTAASLQQTRLPPTFDAFVSTSVRLDASERETLLSGRPVTKLLDSDPAKEVAVFGAIWIAAPAADYVRLVQDIERFESGGAFRTTKRIGNPPSASDFATLQLPKEDVRDLRDCRVGDCDLKLGADALRTLRAQVDWTKPSAEEQANAIFRRLALDYVTGYVKGGNDELAVYRDKEHPLFVADEFRSMLDRVPPLATYLPDVKRYLLEYPRTTLSGSVDFFYWQETEFGLKPTIRMNHLVFQERAEYTVVASKMLYATHYFWTALELRVLMPDPSRGDGFWLITINRSRCDGLSGFLGRLLRGRVRNEVRRGTLAALTATKTKLEGTDRRGSAGE